MTILITDVNVSPSLEANSLLFQAAAHSGMTHGGLLRQLVTNSCSRQRLPLPPFLPVDPVELSILCPPLPREVSD